MNDISLVEYTNLQEAKSFNFGNVSFTNNALFYLITFSFGKAFGTAVFLLRLPSVVFISIAAVYFYKLIYNNVNYLVAVWASIFFFTNNLITFNAQLIHHGSLLLLFSVLSAYYIFELATENKNKLIIKYTVICILGFYTSNSYLWFVLFQFLFIVVNFPNLKKQIIKVGLLFVLFTNYFLFAYIFDTNIFAFFFNKGMEVFWIKSFCYNLTFDYFFFNLLFLLTFAIALNTYFKGLVKNHSLKSFKFFKFSFYLFVLLFVCYFKSSISKENHLYNSTAIYLCMFLIILLSVIFGHNTFSAKSQILLTMLYLFTFLPSIKLGVNHGWHSKGVLKLIQNGSPNNHYFCSDSLPIKFYYTTKSVDEQAQIKARSYYFNSINELTKLIQNKSNSKDTLFLIANEEKNDTKMMDEFLKFGYHETKMNYYFANYFVKSYAKNN